MASRDTHGPRAASSRSGSAAPGGEATVTRWTTPPNFLVSILLVAAGLILLADGHVSVPRLVGAVLVGALGVWGVGAAFVSRLRDEPRGRRGP